MVNPVRAHSPSCLHAVRGNGQALVEVVARQAAIGPGLGDEVEELVDVPFGRRGLGHQLLNQNVERSLGRQKSIESFAMDRSEQGTTLDEVVAGLRVEAALWHAVAIVIGTPDPLQERGDVAWRAQLTDQVDRPDIDAEFERRRGDEGLQVASAKATFDHQPAIFGQASVVGHHVCLGTLVLLREPLPQLVADALGHPAGVDENEGGRVSHH